MSDRRGHRGDAGGISRQSPEEGGGDNEGADLRSRLSIGPGCQIGPNAVVYYDTEIGGDTLIGEGASIRELCRVGTGCAIGRYVTLDRDVRIGNECSLMSHVNLVAKTRVGNRVFIASMVTGANDNTFGAFGYHEENLQGHTIEDDARIGPGPACFPGS